MFNESTESWEAIILKLDNYNRWAPRMEYLLAKNDYWWTIGSITSTPLTLDPIVDFLNLGLIPSLNKFQTKWQLDNDNAIRAIMAHCDDTRYEEVKALIEDGSTAAEIWNELKLMYDKKDAMTNARMLSELVQIEIPHGATCEETKDALDHFNRLATHIQNCKMSLPDVLTVLCLRMGLANFNSIASSMLNQRDITRAQVTTAFLNMSMTEKQMDRSGKVMVGRINKRKDIIGISKHQ